MAVPIADSSIWKSQLEERGWTIVDIPVSFWTPSTPHHQKWLEQPSCWKELHDGLFNEMTLNTTIATCVESESGGGAGTEQKLSWELKRELVSRALQSATRTDCRLASVLDLLHAIAVHVNGVCCSEELRPLLVCDDTQRTLDLLRAFRYEPQEQQDSPVLGSRSHTDWGSWTIVWQDTVGGLQTYQHTDNTWVDVPATPPDDKKRTLRFVVHVGDVTSLATGYPSPLHRVLSPQNERRHSFVYFVYPEPTLKLRTLAQLSTTVTLDLEQHSLFKDQSANGRSDMTSRDRYESVLHLPLSEVFANKWAQVQR